MITHTVNLFIIDSKMISVITSVVSIVLKIKFAGTIFRTVMFTVKRGEISTPYTVLV